MKGGSLMSITATKQFEEDNFEIPGTKRIKIPPQSREEDVSPSRRNLSPMWKKLKRKKEAEEASQHSSFFPPISRKETKKE